MTKVNNKYIDRLFEENFTKIAFIYEKDKVS